MTLHTVYRLLNRFEEAVRSEAWKGSMEPKEIRAVEKRYMKTRKALRDAIQELISLVPRAVEGTHYET